MGQLSRISQLLGQALIVLLIFFMMVFTTVHANNHCNVGQRITAKFFYLQEGNILGINNSKVTGVEDRNHSLYTITDSDINSTAFFIFDPKAKQFICAKRKRRNKFQVKSVPNPIKLCMFKETYMDSLNGYVILQSVYHIRLNATTALNNVRHMGSAVVIKHDDTKCHNSKKHFCTFIKNRKKQNPRKKKQNVMPQKILDACR